MRQVFVIAVEHFLGHAVVAAKVAAVGDADAQVAQRTATLVAQQSAGDDGGGRHKGQAVALVEQGDHTFCHPAILPDG